MNNVKIGQYTFHIENSGLLIIFNEGNQEHKSRFDPEESTKLLDFLSEHQHEFSAAIKPSEPLFPSKEWQNDYLEKKFKEMPD